MIAILDTGPWVALIVTFDRKDFTIYRLPKKKNFMIMP